MLIKLNNNFFFRKRILKNKLIRLTKTNKISKKLRFKKLFNKKLRFKKRLNKKLKKTRFKKLFNKKIWKLFNNSIRKVFKKRLFIKKRLKIVFKKRFNVIKKKYYFLPKSILNDQNVFSFKWVSKPYNYSFNQKSLIKYVLIFSDKHAIQNYTLNTTIFYNLFFKSFNVWLTLESNFFKNYLAVYKQSFLNNSIIYKRMFFTNNKLSLINTESSTEISRSFYKNKQKITPTFKSFKDFSKLVNLLSKQLPYVELMRSFRVNLKKKILSYDINVMDFFNSSLLRVNQDSVNYKLNVIKYNKIYKTFKSLGLLKIYDYNNSEYVVESNYDTNLVKSNVIKNFKKKFIITNTTDFNILNKQKKNNLAGIFDTNSILLRNVDLLSNLFGNTTLYKYLIFNNNSSYFHYNKNNNKNNNLAIVGDLNKYLFNSRINLFSKSNLITSTVFKYTIKRKLLKIVNFHKFSSNITMWYYNILIRFMENCSGKKVYLKFNPFIENSLSFNDIARCNIWSTRITGFQRILGPKIFLKESLKILHIAIKFKDPTFLSNWIKGMLYRMSFWKYRLLFRYLKYTMRYLFWLYFPELEFKGFKLRLKGKISVAGNARTRTLMYRIGETGYSKFNNRIVSDFTTINTFTGVLGFKIWFFF